VANVLITTQPGDVHADAVRWAVEKLGHTCRRWIPARAARHTNSFFAGPDGIRLVLDGPDGPIDLSSVDTVWLRRFRAPEAPALLAEGDRVIAKRESESFLRGLIWNISHGRRCINDADAQRGAGLKGHQLAIAHRVGLNIPATVMTNDIVEARAFVERQNGRAIYKGFLPAVWSIGDQAAFMLYTSVVTAEQLTDPDMLTYSPGIFQEFVEKAYELRVTIFGRTCIAARISDQDEVDWRTTYKMNLEPYELPDSVRAKLFAFMNELGLVMGSIDLIVTKSGEFVFLEINEQGQFLWVEELSPSRIPMLAPFARFLAGEEEPWRPSASDEDISMRAYGESEAHRTFAANDQDTDTPSYYVQDGERQTA
jgi:hypothetical protein